MIPVLKKCSKCKRKYFWNPGVRQLWCPYCGPSGTPGAGDIPWKKHEEIIWEVKNKEY